MNTSFTLLSSTEVIVGDYVYTFKSQDDCNDFTLCLESGDLGACLATCGPYSQRLATNQELGIADSPEDDESPSP